MERQKISTQGYYIQWISGYGVKLLLLFIVTGLLLGRWCEMESDKSLTLFDTILTAFTVETNIIIYMIANCRKSLFDTILTTFTVETKPS